mgnify:CR=1 FL=1
MHRTKEKKVLGEFDSIILQNMSHNLPLFCAPAWPSYHVIENHLLADLAWKRDERPECAVCYQDKFFVSYPLAHCIKVFDKTGVHLCDTGCMGSNDGEFSRPLGLLVDKYNQLVVCDGNNRRLQLFSLSGTFLSKLQGKYFNSSKPCYAAINNDNLFVADSWGDRIFCFSFGVLGKYSDKLSFVENTFLWVLYYISMNIEHMVIPGISSRVLVFHEKSVCRVMFWLISDRKLSCDKRRFNTIGCILHHYKKHESMRFEHDHYSRLWSVASRRGRSGFARSASRHVHVQ